MNTVIKLYIVDDEGEKVFGEGPYRLLKNTAELGSLRKAAISMDMAYSKARKLLATAENAYGRALVLPTIGGRTGGGSTLTEFALELLKKYEIYKTRCMEANTRIYDEVFGTK